MTDYRTQFDYLIQPLSVDNPRLYDALKLISSGFQNLENQINPIQKQIDAISQPSPPPLPPSVFQDDIFPDYIRLTWVSGDTASVLYEIRKGIVWDLADFVVKTPSLSTNLNPITPTEYVHTYLIKSINADGVYSTLTVQLTFVLIIIQAPVITGQVIDNNVLLRWNDPYRVGNFRTAYYNIYKNSVFFGTVASTFTIISETIAGNYQYTIEAVDIAGNVGETGAIWLTVDQPPDFELFGSWESQFKVVDPAGTLNIIGSTLVNCLRTEADPVNPKLLAIVDNVETWLAHYTVRGWNHDDDAIAAGSPYYSQPGEVSGSYTEVIDYGALISNIIVNLDWTEEIIVGNVTVTTTIESSTDNVSWSSPVSGPSVFFASFRYLRVKLIFTGGPGALKQISHFTINLDVKREVDSGSVLALASDASGTVVTFNKAYKDVDSITLAVKSLEQVTAIYDFLDIANPVSFKVLCFDGSGNRIDYLVSWKSRGVV